MIDTNVFMSALMFPSSTPSGAMQLVMERHELVLCDYIVNELRNKIGLKRPDLVPALNELLDTMPYENVSGTGDPTPAIKDPKDAPILDAAIAGNVGVVISGDKHFKSLSLTKPRVNSPADFLKKNR
ncbi:MAG: PIN domain-containing protein [Coriobacteriales bacterium]|nr:PIN domain-containing protein [Coriobacteriales bacterium]